MYQQQYLLTLESCSKIPNRMQTAIQWVLIVQYLIHVTREQQIILVMVYQELPEPQKLQES